MNRGRRTGEAALVRRGVQVAFLLVFLALVRIKRPVIGIKRIEDP